MQAESSLWGRRRVVGSKLKHDGSLGAMFKSPELAHVGTELVEGARDQTGVAPQRGMVAVAATIADAQKDEGEQKAEGAAQTSDDGVNSAPNQTT